MHFCVVTVQARQGGGGGLEDLGHRTDGGRGRSTQEGGGSGKPAYHVLQSPRGRRGHSMALLGRIQLASKRGFV